jgi:hypothetical protein
VEKNPGRERSCLVDCAESPSTIDNGQRVRHRLTAVGVAGGRTNSVCLSFSVLIRSSGVSLTDRPTSDPNYTTSTIFPEYKRVLCVVLGCVPFYEGHVCGEGSDEGLASLRSLHSVSGEDIMAHLCRC